MDKATQQQLANLISALNALAQAITLQTQAIGQLIMEQDQTAADEPPMFDLSGKPIVIR